MDDEDVGLLGDERGDGLGAFIRAKLGIAISNFMPRRSACFFITDAHPSVRSMPIVTGTKAIVLPSNVLK